MSAARLHNSSNALKRQQSESAGKSAEVDAQAANLSARQAELDSLSRELTKDRSLLEQLAGQLEVRRWWLSYVGSNCYCLYVLTARCSSC